MHYSTKRDTLLAVFLPALLIISVFGVFIWGMVASTTAAREYRAGLTATPITVLSFRNDFEADDYDEAEHWVMTRERGLLPIADSGALGTDDDAVYMRLQGNVDAGLPTCVVIEHDSGLGDAVTDLWPC